MCQIGTFRVPARLLAAALAAASLWGQAAPGWRKVGPTSYEAGLASPAGGAVARVWYSPAGSTLFARTAAGKTFQTADFETWTEAADAPVPPEPPTAEPARTPEPGARVVALREGREWFALERSNLYRSQDAGRSWENLTGWQSHPIIGGGQRGVALAPAGEGELVAANDFGVWRTMDGGRTWAGLNEGLPNLQVARILSTPTGTAGVRVRLSGTGQLLELPPGGAGWEAWRGEAPEEEAALIAQFGPRVGATLTAAARVGRVVHLGSADGRFWYSSNGGESFVVSGLPVGVAGRVERIAVDPAAPEAAVAALSGAGLHVLRTFNGGVFWDSMDAGLPAVGAFSVAADATAGAVYLGTENGLYWASADLRAASGPPRWTSIGDGLPGAAITDLRLDPAGVQLYVAAAGYGLFAAAAPHRRRAVKLVSAGDFSARAAAPGSLLSVVGARVNSARAAGLDFPVLGIPTEEESQIQVPYGASGPAYSLALETAAGRFLLPLQLQPVSPAIFVSRDGAAMILDADSGMAVDGRTPAKSNGRIQIFATGLGRVQPELAAGLAAPLQNPPAVAAQVHAFLNGNPLAVTRATLAPGNVGWYVVEAQLPPVANFGAADLYIAAGGQESNHVRIVIEP